MPERPPILGVAEIVLNVRDMRAMRDFYERVMGFAPSAHNDPSDPEPTILFFEAYPADSPLGRNGHPMLLALIDPERHPPARGRFVDVEKARSTLNHIAFEIDPATIDDHRAYLQSQGLEVTDIAFPAMRARALFVRDPEGNSIEFIAHDPSTA